MFPQLPEEMERMIWDFYFVNVLKEVRERVNIWTDPSLRLRDLCHDQGCIQIGHTEFESFCPDTELGEIVKRECLNKVCANCHCYGFPCYNAIGHGEMNDKLTFFWSLRHYDDPQPDNYLDDEEDDDNYDDEDPNDLGFFEMIRLRD